MSLARHSLPPTSSLPPLRSLDALTEDQIGFALRNLHALYCPLPRALAFQPRLKPRDILSIAPTPVVDSGYASGTEEDDGEDADDADDATAILRADTFERTFAIRWLTAFIARAEEWPIDDEDARQRAIDDATSILASFTDDQEEDEEDMGITRDFSFPLSLPSPAPRTIKVSLNDAPLTGADHTDVGLQSWGAAIILSELICASPAHFGFTPALGHSPRVIELGAGTGLVSLALARLLPHVPTRRPSIIATDYHPAVLTNLQANVATNFPGRTPPPVDTCLLDWSAPVREPPLDAPADVIVAADVVYAPEHARWLRDCAAQLLAPEGVFWLIVSVRTTGRFEGISDTVEAAFAEGDCPTSAGRTLAIMHIERLDKRKGIGRADESGYKLFRIRWA
jgi:predicted nicotinamide N-methyase